MMSRFIIKGAVFLLSVVFFVSGNVRAEVIDNYSVEIKINKDATIDVVEIIDYNFENLQKHGIYRKIPVRYDNGKGNRRYMAIKNVKVSVDGQKGEFTKSKKDGYLNIKIGDKDKFVTGKHKYNISYTVKNAINFFNTHDELYWNAIGLEWLIKMNNVDVVIKGDNIINVDSFKGMYGSTANCKQTKESSNLVKFNCGELLGGYGATVVIGMDSGTIEQPGFAEKTFLWLLYNWIFLFPGIAFLWMFRLWWLDSRDPKGAGVIIPYYDVADDLSVGEVAMIVHGELKSKKISAMIIQLAVKGFIKIERVKSRFFFIKDTYVFTKTVEKEKKVGKNNNKKIGGKTSEEDILYEALFSIGTNGKVSTKELKNKFHTSIRKIEKNIADSVIEKGYLANDFTKVVGKWIMRAIAIGFLIVMLSVFFEWKAVVAGISTGVIIALLGCLMTKYNKKGIITKEKLLGFKLYLKTAEKDRLKFHNAPEKNPEIFEKFLPYAMVFGVEKEWAEQFSDIYEQQPEWYSSYNGQVFSSMALASSLNSFSSVAASSLLSSPSSASSGGSGFSGGGSGGGGGGGGGGSW